MDLAAVADELYALPPEQFTTARTSREKEAKAAGDKDLAAQIHALVKPNQVAWLANQLARQHGDEVGPLLDLGAGLRDAAGSLTGDQLRDFTKQKRLLVSALVGQGRRLAAAHGRKVSDLTMRGLEDTLNAGLADPAAAALLVAGRLTTGLQYSGFGPATGDGGPNLASVQTTDHPAGRYTRSGSKEQRLAERVASADRDVEQAMAAVAEAGAARADAEAAAERAAGTSQEIEGEVTWLREALERATTAQAEADWERRRTRKELESAERAVTQAERRIGEAKERRAALTPGED